MALFGLVGFVLFVFWVWAIYDVVTTDATAIRNLPKPVWVVIVIVLGFWIFSIGPFIWVLAGRPQRADAAPSRGAPRGDRRPRRPHAPEPSVAPEPHRIVTDRRSAELDRMLEEWERSKGEKGATES